MEADLLDAFDTLDVLVSTLGYPLFESIGKKESVREFFCQIKNTDAKGDLVEDGFVVRKGSLVRLDIPKGAVKQLSPIREKLMKSGVLVEEEGQLRFTQDYLFNTPSGAAFAVSASFVNGWDVWKDADGRTLHEAKRAGNEEQEA